MIIENKKKKVQFNKYIINFYFLYKVIQLMAVDKAKE